ncbi:MAG TPA: LemA family protein [bacterium]|mgnify:CR=1 FL=1|jgi:LemA protein|nr:LemA family protein [bacterium]MDX9804604.1 LemA family protein [bacterium]HNW16336.1 LemA family protein [bacterium]HNZ53930.1 LemA family protein [bacterium]HOG42973.1 LemA family protein [bacterium]
MTAALIFVGALFLLVLFAAVIFIGIYNALVVLRNRVKNSWSQIDVQLKRRHDLIPNLVETAKGYMKHENETFVKVTEARSKAMNAGNSGSVKDIGAAEADLSGSLAKLLLTVENYPELKANQNFLALQEELTSTENKIAFSRQAYNDDVMMFNNKIEMFPSSIVAGMFNFEKSEFFEIEDKQEKLAPKVSFN